MNCYFEEGETFTWIRDRDRKDKNLIISLRMLKEKHRSGNKQAMIAEDIRTGKKYFVKVLFCTDLEQVYVEKESKVQLYSPYVIRIYGGMLDEKKRRFITLVEYIEENDLSDLVRTHGLAGSTWNEKMKVCHTIALKILYGIDHYMSMYWQDPIVHRDLKPENILASPDGETVKIIDFDWVHLHDSNVTVMLRREQKGTPGYADPRYWNSYICRKEMDIYSAGLVLYFLYTGRHHFYGNEELQRYMVGDDYAYELKDMPGIDEPLKRIIAKMIAREEERYGDIREVIADMEAYLKEIGRMPKLPELLREENTRDTIRFSYKVGDVKYSPYVKNYRFIPIEFGRKQERSQNGRMSGHILSFYRVGDEMRSVILQEDCHKIKEKERGRVREGDIYSYAGTEIEVLQIKKVR
ncbi:MAG: protein kinase [Anaerobutyricum sp.]|nr:protein kinase [Eubacterium sp.]MDY6046427.1 protein kinase [Anaerobutyricum sp.]